MYVEIKLRPSHGTIPTMVDGVEVDMQTVNVTAVFSRSDIDAIADAFDPASSSSPPAADCRSIARPIIEAIIAARSTP